MMRGNMHIYHNERRLQLKNWDSIDFKGRMEENRHCTLLLHIVCVWIYEICRAHV
jgi:hypothetical protein